MARDTRPSPALMLTRGLLRRCPRCGGGRLFRRWFTMVERCPTCGMKFEREEGFFLGAYVVNFGVMLITLATFITVSIAITLPDPPALQLALLGMAISSVVAILFYPFSRTVWSAFDLWMKWLEPDELADADAAVTSGPSR